MTIYIKVVDAVLFARVEKALGVGATDGAELALCLRDKGTGGVVPRNILIQNSAGCIITVGLASWVWPQ